MRWQVDTAAQPKGGGGDVALSGFAFRTSEAARQAQRPMASAAVDDAAVSTLHSACMPCLVVSLSSTPHPALPAS